MKTSAQPTCTEPAATPARLTIRWIGRSVAAASIAGWTTLAMATAPSVSAQPCPDVEIVFARGSGEAPGVGGVGQGFVDALTTQAGARTVNVYPVNYAASTNFDDRMEFARTVVDGIRDAGQHVESTAANCPNTRIVLGGYSQGAAVAGFVTSASVPQDVPADYRTYVPQPMPTKVADHVAAVVLFGKPSNEWLNAYGSPSITIGPAYVPKTIELCDPGDTICNGAPGGQPSIAHALYGVNGTVGEGAGFAVNHL